MDIHKILQKLPHRYPFLMVDRVLEVEKNVRIRALTDAARIDRLLRGLKPKDRRTRLVIAGGLNRPPFERTSQGAELFTLARTLGKPLGIPLKEAAVGGGSDGNFTAAVGVPTLDGLGAVGGGAHADHEYVLVEHLVPRAQLVTALIERL